MTPLQRPAHVLAMTWDEVVLRLNEGATAILPIGSGSKQHGWHMPLGVDQLQAEWFASRIAEWTDALIWPTLTYGAYPAFVAYPGSLSLSDATFEAVVREIVLGLAGSGARSVLILDVGHTTIAGVARAISGLKAKAAIQQVSISQGKHFQEMVAQHAQQSHGSHADEVETSIVLAIAPHLVAMERAAASPPLPDGPKAGPLTPHDSQSPNYTSSGSFGDPRLASAEKGRIFVEAILQDLKEATITSMCPPSNGV